MRFLVDAQLPLRLASALSEWGHDAAHTSSLPSGNSTEDASICAVADAESRIVLTKDSDFADSFVLRATPAKLLLVTTGNIGNDDLIDLLGRRMADLEREFAESSFIELNQTNLIVHQ